MLKCRIFAFAVGLSGIITIFRNKSDKRAIVPQNGQTRQIIVNPGKTDMVSDLSHFVIFCTFCNVCPKMSDSKHKLGQIGIYRIIVVCMGMKYSITGSR
jgi:hypothetical protein